MARIRPSTRSTQTKTHKLFHNTKPSQTLSDKLANLRNLILKTKRELSPTLQGRATAESSTKNKLTSSTTAKTKTVFSKRSRKG